MPLSAPRLRATTFTSNSKLLSPGEPQRPKSLVLENFPPPGGLLPIGTGIPASSSSSSPGLRRGSGASPLVSANRRAVFTPDVEEIRVSPVISKRGFLNILDQRNKVRVKDTVSVLARLSVH